jgi:amino acid adenylation domain-containing protein
LEETTRQFPDKKALRCSDQSLTYLEVDRMANRLANALIERGVERGDRVAIFLPNTVEAVAAIFATLKAGGVFLVVNHTTKPDKLQYILDNCGAKALIGEGKDKTHLDSMQTEVPSLQFVVVADGDSDAAFSFNRIQETHSAERPSVHTIDRDLACLIYTSGSTGAPKGVMSDHSNVAFATDSIITCLDNSEDDVVLSALPLSFDYGLYQLFMTFRFGGTLVLERSFAFPAAILKRIEKEQVTGFPGVPTMFAMLLQMDLGAFDLSSLRYITNTAAALPPEHIQALRDKLPDVTLYSMYGLTETKRTTYLPPEQLDNRPDSVGIPIPGTEAWIEDQEGRRLGPGETGELVVRGRHVMRGYWDNPEATAERFRPGPLPGEKVCYTGDLFRQDEDGYFYFVGRKDSIIKSRGEKVAPKEVENVLYELDGVLEAAVIGVSDPIMGTAIKALLVVEGTSLSERAVMAHCRDHLEDYMVPKFVEFRDELPKTSSGKIRRSALA